MFLPQKDSSTIGKTHSINELASHLLVWFDSAHHQATARPMPWRQVRDPYRVLLSEIMLQQTQVSTVIPYYEKFLENWPTLTALAQANEDEVLKTWEGLGYYSRARNLLTCVRQVEAAYHGELPQDLKELQKLKGIGDYTAGAIRSIAFQLPAAAVDGNVVRVLARLTATPWNPSDLKQRREVSEMVLHLQPIDRPGDFNEALMDLGATICTPQNPDCPNCPLQAICLAHQTATTANFPSKKPRAPVPVEHKICLIYRQGNRIHVNRRPDRGLLAGLYEFDWADTAFDLQNLPSNVQKLGEKRHVFTHRIWHIQSFLVDLDLNLTLSADQGEWIDAKTLKSLAFPTAIAAWRDEIVVALLDA